MSRSRRSAAAGWRVSSVMPELVAVERHRVQALAPVSSALLPCVLAAGPLDLDDLGTHVAQELRAHRPGDEPAEVEDADPVEGAGPGRHRMSPPAQSQRSSSNSDRRRVVTKGARDQVVRAPAPSEGRPKAGRIERATQRRSGRRHDVDDRRPRPADRAGPAREQRRQVLTVGREQGDPRDASQADLPIDDEAANGIVLAPRPEPIAPERVLGEPVVERRRRRGVPHHRAVVGRELEAALGPGLAQRQRCRVLPSRQNDQRRGHRTQDLVPVRAALPGDLEPACAREAHAGDATALRDHRVNRPGDGLEQPTTAIGGVHGHVQPHAGEGRLGDPGDVESQQPAVVLRHEPIPIPRTPGDELEPLVEPGEEPLHLFGRPVEGDRQEPGPLGSIVEGQRSILHVPVIVARRSAANTVFPGHGPTVGRSPCRKPEHPLVVPVEADRSRTRRAEGRPWIGLRRTGSPEARCLPDRAAAGHCDASS